MASIPKKWKKWS